MNIKETLHTLLVPNPDHCEKCEQETRSSYPHYAPEYWRQHNDGVKAGYRCLKHHTWETYWSRDTMIHCDTLATMIAFDGVIPPFEYRKP